MWREQTQPRKAGRRGRQISRAAAASGKLDGVVPIFGALGDATRLQIVSRLGAHGPLPTATLTSSTALSRQAVTKHLRALEGAGVVQSRRNGRDRVWTLRTESFTKAQKLLADISGQWDEAIERLRRLVEDAEN
jgi:DNA-binding transcriptional ArsR family regulator